MSNKREVEKLIREFVMLEMESVPQRKDTDINQMSGDSLDLAMDHSIASFDKSAKGKDGQLQMEKFVSDLAIMADHIEDQLDLKGTLVRRVANYLTKAYDEKVSKEVLRMLEDAFGVSSDPSYQSSSVDASAVPLSKDGGPDPSGAIGGAPPA